MKLAQVQNRCHLFRIIFPCTKGSLDAIARSPPMDETIFQTILPATLQLVLLLRVMSKMRETARGLGRFF
jgi:hypothetical protein